jgi:small subunit ribosomal protein S9
VTDVEQPEDEQRTTDAETPAEEPAAPEAASDAPAPAADAAEAPAAEEQPVAEAEQPEQPAAEPEQPAAEQQPAAEPEQPAAEQQPAAEVEQPAAEAEAPAPAAEAAAPAAAEAPAAEAPAAEELVQEQPRIKPEIPGADLVPDIVPEGGDALGREGSEYDEDHAPTGEPGAEGDEEAEAKPISGAEISLASGARYMATGKRKTAVARVTLKPGSGEYRVNGKALEAFFPRPTLQRNIRQPLETVGYEARMDVIAKLHGGGVSAQAGALRHGISRALLEADPNLRGELKRRGFLTRDARAKERKKAGLKKARKRPQFSKR